MWGHGTFDSGLRSFHQKLVVSDVQTVLAFAKCLVCGVFECWFPYTSPSHLRILWYIHSYPCYLTMSKWWDWRWDRSLFPHLINGLLLNREGDNAQEGLITFIVSAPSIGKEARERPWLPVAGLLLLSGFLFSSTLPYPFPTFHPPNTR